jgi:transposase-like protein
MSEYQCPNCGGSTVKMDSFVNGKPAYRCVSEHNCNMVFVEWRRPNDG